MHALYIVLPALCILAIAYRYYSAFIATRIWMLDDSRQTPAHAKYDGANFYPTSKWVLFGHHFAAITGAGPLVGPMLAAQFGWAPGLMWLVDFFFEYFSEGAAYFQQSFSEILNDSLLGLSAVTLGAIAWLAILLVKDPKRVFKQQ